MLFFLFLLYETDLPGHNNLFTKSSEEGIVEHKMRHGQFTSTCCRILVMEGEHEPKASEPESAWIKQ